MQRKELEQYLGKNVEIISFKGEVFQGILYTSYDYFIRRDPDIEELKKENKELSNLCGQIGKTS